MTREALWVPVRNGLLRSKMPDDPSDVILDESSLMRNFKAIEEYLESAHVGASQLEPGSVTTEAIAPGAVTDDKISDVSVSKLTDGQLSAVATIVGALVSGNLRWDAQGQVLTDADGGVLFSLPSDVGVPFLRGQLEALGLLVENDFVLRGTNNLMEAGSAIRMGGAATGETVGNPAASPGLKVEWETTEFPDQEPRHGLAWDATNTSWWTTTNPQQNFPLADTPARVVEYDNDAGLTRLRSASISSAERVFGAVRVGTRVYVLFRNTTGGVILRTFSESTLEFIASVNVDNAIGGAGTHGWPCIGTDGSSIFICDLSGEGEGKTVRFHEFTLADSPAFIATTTTSSTGNPTFDSGVDRLVGFATAESNWWVASRRLSRTGDDPGEQVEAWELNGVFRQNTKFLNGQSILGMTHDGTRFWTLGGSALVKHTNWKWTTESGKYHVAFTYVDDNSTVSVGSRPLGAGDFETKKSPSAAIAMQRRARLRCSAAAVDTALTGITHVGWYIERGASEPTLDYQADTAVTNGLVTVRVVEDFTTDASPEAPPSSNTFPSGAAGDFAEFIASGGEPILRGNGFSRCKVSYSAGGLITDAAARNVRFGTEVVDTDSYHPSTTDGLSGTPDSTYDITVPFAGQYLALAHGVFASNSTGRRRIGIGVNGASPASDREITIDGVTGEATKIVLSVVLDLAAGDDLRVEVFQNSGGTLALTSAKFSILFLGPA